MKRWIIFIIQINSRLGALSRIEDNYIEQLSQNTFCETIKTYNEIMRHIDRKMRYINLRVMFKECAKALPQEEFCMLQSYAKNSESAADLAKKIFCSRAQIFRLLEKWFKKCRTRLELLGYTEERFCEEYSDMMRGKLWQSSGEKRINEAQHPAVAPKENCEPFSERGAGGQITFPC